jgi:hypothetical protein
MILQADERRGGISRMESQVVRSSRKKIVNQPVIVGALDEKDVIEYKLSTVMLCQLSKASFQELPGATLACTPC